MFVRGDMLLHRGKAHRVVRRELGDALAPAEGTEDDVAPRRVGECGKDDVGIERGNH